MPFSSIFHPTTEPAKTRFAVSTAPIAIILGAVVVTGVSEHVFGGGDLTVFHKIVDRGDPADVLGEGLFFADFNMHPDVEAVFASADFPARIGNQGDVTFHAFATEDGGLGDCPFADQASCPPSGLIRAADGQLELIFAVGDEAPGLGLPFLGFPIFIPNPPRLSDGSVALIAQAGEEFFGNAQTGIWTNRFGAMEPFILPDSFLPEMPADATLKLPYFFELHHETMYFVGSFDTDLLPTDSRPQGLWRNVDGEFEPINVAGQHAWGMPDDVFFGDTDNANIVGTLGTFDFNDADRIVFTAFMRGPGLEVQSDEAIWIETDKGFEVFLTEGTEPPAGLFDPGSTFSGGNVLEGAFVNTVSPAIRMNNNGQIVFYADVDVPGDPPIVPGVWSNRNGELELVMRGRMRGVAFSVPGDEAPGVPNGNFFFPAHTEITDDGDIVLRAFVETNNDVFDSTIGIWVDRGNGFIPVAFEAGPVPGVPGATFLPEVGNIRGVKDFELEADGSITYWGLFFDPQNVLRAGVFRHAPDDTGEILFQTGGDVEIDGAGEIRTVLDWNLGTGGSDDGEKVIEVLFGDGTIGLYTYDITPDPTTILGDLDGDGIVGTTDLLAMLGAWGVCPPKGDCPADLDGDGSVGTTDLLILLGNWG